jgi:toxin FitB
LSYLVDTNVISELRKGSRRNPNLSAWYDSVQGFDLHLSVLVVGEIRKGIENARRSDATQAQALETWLQGLFGIFAGRILPITEAVADEWGRMNAIRPVSTIDGLLAATAKVHSLTFVTRNTSDVKGLGVQLLDPFQSAGEG